MEMRRELRSPTPAEAIQLIDATTHAATSKATPVDADELPLIDSAASYGLKRLTWANLKATLKTYFDTLYDFATVVHAATSKTTPVGADEFGIADSAASYGAKRVTLTNLIASLKSSASNIWAGTSDVLFNTPKALTDAFVPAKNASVTGSFTPDFSASWNF